MMTTNIPGGGGHGTL